MGNINCPVCKQPHVTVVEADTDGMNSNTYKCGNCGKFHCDHKLMEELAENPQPQYALSSMVREYNEYSYDPQKDNVIRIGVEHFKEAKPLNIKEKINRFLFYISAKQAFAGEAVVIHNIHAMPCLFYCKSIEELRFLAKQLTFLNLCEFVDPDLIVKSSTCRLTYLGEKRLDEYRKSIKHGMHKYMFEIS
jgi:hypothetical protein